LKKGTEEIDNLVDLGDLEEGTVADTNRRDELKQLFADVVILQETTANRGETRSGHPQ
jgi:hypothetical protein